MFDFLGDEMGLQYNTSPYISVKTCEQKWKGSTIHQKQGIAVRGSTLRQRPDPGSPQSSFSVVAVPST